MKWGVSFMDAIDKIVSVINACILKIDKDGVIGDIPSFIKDQFCQPDSFDLSDILRK